MLTLPPSNLAFGMPGPTEWLIILAIVGLLFGGRKLPGLARSMGSSITQFKRGLKEDPDRLDEGSGDKESTEES